MLIHLGTELGHGADGGGEEGAGEEGIPVGFTAELEVLVTVEIVVKTDVVVDPPEVIVVVTGQVVTVS